MAGGGGTMYSEREHRIKTEIAEILDSKNQQWISAISMIVDVMYQQFIREESENKDRTLEKMMVGDDENTVEDHERDGSRAA